MPEISSTQIETSNSHYPEVTELSPLSPYISSSTSVGVVEIPKDNFPEHNSCNSEVSSSSESETDECDDKSQREKLRLWALEFQITNRAKCSS